MRDELQQVVIDAINDSEGNSEKITDAILAALPDMVQPLVWYNAGTEIQSQSLIHFYRVYANTAGGYTLDDNEAYSIHRSQDEAKDAAQANHVAQIMSALGLAPQGEQG